MKLTMHVKTFGELTTGELYELLRVRAEFFVVEQDCPYQDLDIEGEWEGIGNCIIGYENKAPVPRKARKEGYIHYVK